MVRALACHARGRGFKSRRSRFICPVDGWPFTATREPLPSAPPVALPLTEVATTREITGAPAGVALALAGLVLAIWWLRRKEALTVPRLLAGAVLCVYAAGVLANTAFPVFLGTTSMYGSWTGYLNLVPLRGTEARDVIENVIIFAPLGLLLPLVFPLRTALGVIAAAAALSLSIEALQLLNAVTGHGGHIADINDLLANVLGAAVGYGVVRVAMKVPAIRRAVMVFAWPSSGLHPVPTRSEPETGTPRAI